eukprot:2554021-Pyramimonas_sp.AAC.1
MSYSSSGDAISSRITRASASGSSSSDRRCRPAAGPVASSAEASRRGPEHQAAMYVWAARGGHAER